MARLPTPGSDDGIWGNVLNDFLSQAHNTDGTLAPAVVPTNVLADSAVTTIKLADGAVTPAKLSITGSAPTDTQILTYDATSQKFKWVSPTATVNAINNQYTAAQTADYWISGKGQADGGFVGTSFDTPSSVALSIGGVTATTITVGRSGQVVNMPSILQMSGTTTSDARVNMTGFINSTAAYINSLYNSLTINPTTAASNISGLYQRAVIGNATGNVDLNSLYGISTQVGVDASYTGTLTSARGINVNVLSGIGTKPISTYRGIHVASNTVNVNSGSGAVENTQLYIDNVGPVATGTGTTTNIGIYLRRPAGSGTGTNNNYGMVVSDDNSYPPALGNWSIYNKSAAPSFYNTSINIGTTTNPNNYPLNVSGIAAASTGLVSPSVDTATNTTLNIGNTNATLMNVGRASQVVNMPGVLQINGTTTSTLPSKLTITGELQASSTNFQYGINMGAKFNPQGGSLTNAYGIASVPAISGSNYNLTSFAAQIVLIATEAAYTGTITNGYGLLVGAPSINGPQLIPNYFGIYINSVSSNSGNTSGTLNNTQINVAANSAAAAAGGTINNTGVLVNVPTGSGAGTTVNRGLTITGSGGSGGTGSTTNYAIYNNSPAVNYLQGNTSIGTSTNANNYALNVAGTVGARQTVVQPTADAASVLSVKNAAGTTMFAVNTNTNTISVPKAASDPAVNNGDLYYNTTSNAFRTCVNGAWQDVGSGSGGVTDLLSTATATNVTVASSTGADATIAAATTTTAGVMSAADKTKLDGMSSTASDIYVYDTYASAPALPVDSVVVSRTGT